MWPAGKNVQRLLATFDLVPDAVGNYTQEFEEFSNIKEIDIEEVVLIFDDDVDVTAPFVLKFDTNSQKALKPSHTDLAGYHGPCFKFVPDKIGPQVLKWRPNFQESGIIVNATGHLTQLKSLRMHLERLDVPQTGTRLFDVRIFIKFVFWFDGWPGVSKNQRQFQ